MLGVLTVQISSWYRRMQPKPSSDQSRSTGCSQHDRRHQSILEWPGCGVRLQRRRVLEGLEACQNSRHSIVLCVICYNSKRRYGVVFLLEQFQEIELYVACISHCSFWRSNNAICTSGTKYPSDPSCFSFRVQVPMHQALFRKALLSMCTCSRITSLNQYLDVMERPAKACY